MKTRFFPIFFLVLQFVLYGAAVRTITPKGTDFPAFYSAARLWRQGTNPYDLEKQCDLQLPIRGVPCLPFAHPPVLLPLVALVSNDSFVSSYYRWVIVLALVGLACVIPLFKLSGDLKRSVQAALFLPVVLAVAMGQDTLFVMLAALLWWWLLVERKDFLAGLVLSLAVIKPQLAMLLGLPLLFSRPKAFFGFCVGGFVLLVFSYALVGIEGFRGLIRIVQVMSRGQGFGVNAFAMVSVTGLLARVGVSPLWSWLFFALGLVGNTLLWRKTKTSLNAVLLGIVIAVFCSPHLHFHDLSLLTLPVFFLHPLAPALASVVLVYTYIFEWHLLVSYVLLITIAAVQIQRIRRSTDQILEEKPKQFS